MKIFKEMNVDGKEVCPICKTKEKKQVVLIGIIGTQKGYNIQAIQVHLDCLELFFDKEKNLIFQVIKEKK